MFKDNSSSRKAPGMGSDTDANMTGCREFEKSASTASTPSVLVPDIRPMNKGDDMAQSLSTRAGRINGQRL
jgi:hypothetical protein